MALTWENIYRNRQCVELLEPFIQLQNCHNTANDLGFLADYRHLSFGPCVCAIYISTERHVQAYVGENVKHFILYISQQIMLNNFKIYAMWLADWLISNLCYQAIEQVYLIKWSVSVYIYMNII